MGWVVAINPAAGRRPVSRDRVARALDAAGVEAEIEMPPDRASMRAVLAAAATAERVAVVGGDGTVNLAVDTLVGLGNDRLPILGVLPWGTGCDLLRTFGISQVLEEAAHHLRGDSVYEVDVGELKGAWGNRRFVNVAEAGIGAAAVVVANRLPRRLGVNRYLLSFGVRLPAFPAARIRIETDRRTIEGRALAVIFANAQFFAGGWNIAPKAMLVDGKFDVQVIDVKKTAAPKLIPKVMRGLHLGEKGVTRTSSSWFRLETAEPWPIEADGDPIGNTPVEGRVLPAAIRLKI